MGSACFQAFFSYSHHDAAVDPEVIESFSKKLEQRVNAKLTNASFSIWQDKEKLRIGSQWNSKIERAISDSSIFILILSPKWIESSYCRSEYDFFVDKVESFQRYSEAVAPIMIREVARQAHHFTEEQKRCYKSIKDRQFVKYFATDFLSKPDSEKTLIIDQVADDIAGIIERQRLGNDDSSPEKLERFSTRQQTRYEYDARAHNYKKYDIVSSAEVLIGRINSDLRRDLFAHIDFLPRVYVQSGNARVEFGVRRAVLSISSCGEEISFLKDFDAVRGSVKSGGAYYLSDRDRPNALSICIDPLPGNSVLSDLALPPSENENRLSKVASTTENVSVNDITADLTVNLTPDGIFIFSAEDEQKTTPSLAKKIAAIMTAVAEKEGIVEGDNLQRKIPVRER